MKEPKPEDLTASRDYQAAVSYVPKVPEKRMALEEAKQGIEASFPGIAVHNIVHKAETMGNQAFIVNGEYMFRFPTSDRAAEGLEAERKVLEEVKKAVSLPVPDIEYIGTAPNGLPFVGYKLISGDCMKAAFTRTPEGAIKPHLAAAVGRFFNELHGIDIAKMKELGVHERNLRGKYAGELVRAREALYPVFENACPHDADMLKRYIESAFANYLQGSRNFEYSPAVCHGDLEDEHILYMEGADQVTGIIDFGGAEISDPDSDLWRSYFHYGRKFIEELLRMYQHPDHESLFKKMRFYWTAQLTYRLVRSALGNDKQFPDRLEQFRNRALDGDAADFDSPRDLRKYP